MHDRKKKFPWGIVFTGVLILLAFIVDVLFGTSDYPILTIIFCGIVILYERISPYIYSSR